MWFEFAERHRVFLTPILLLVIAGGRNANVLRSRPRVSFLAGNLGDGGGVNRVTTYLSAMLSEQASVKVIAVGPTAKPSYPLSCDVALQRRANWLSALAAIRREKPDFLIGPWTQANLVLIVAFGLSGTRVVAVEHASWKYQRRAVRILRRMFYPFAWRIVVLNPTDLAHYRTFLSNARLIPNPVPPLQIEPTGEREKLIVAIGHLLPNKNFIDAVHAMALSTLEDSGWELAIIGAGPEEERLRKAIGDAGLRRTRIHPPTGDLASWYSRASLSLVTAKVEVFSLVLAEAMSAGVVPIAYAADGPSYILEDFPDHLVAMGDVDGLAQRMRRFANSATPSLRSRMSHSVERRFAPAVIANDWSGLLAEAAATERHTSS